MWIQKFSFLGNRVIGREQKKVDFLYYWLLPQLPLGKKIKRFSKKLKSHDNFSVYTHNTLSTLLLLSILRRPAMKRRSVPEILWRLFGNRARTLGDTIISLISLRISANCQCKGRRCLGCIGENDAMSFLLRENDPDEYRKLLKQCFIVVSDQAAPLWAYDPHCRWPHLEVSAFLPSSICFISIITWKK